MYKNISYNERWVIQDVEVYIFAIQDVLALDEEKVAIEDLYVEVLAHYKSSKKKDEFVVSRILHHYVFGHKTPISYRDSAPFFHPNYHLSISHSSGFVAIGYSKTNRFGIDLEATTNRLEVVKYKILHPEEVKFYDQIKNKSKQYLHRIWTAKEACYKASWSNHFSFISYLSSNIFQDNASLIIEETKETFELQFKTLEKHYFCLAIVKEEL